MLSACGCLEDESGSAVLEEHPPEASPCLCGQRGAIRMEKGHLGRPGGGLADSHPLSRSGAGQECCGDRRRKQQGGRSNPHGPAWPDPAGLCPPRPPLLVVRGSPRPAPRNGTGSAAEALNTRQRICHQSGFSRAAGPATCPSMPASLALSVCLSVQTARVREPGTRVWKLASPKSAG